MNLEEKIKLIIEELVINGNFDVIAEVFSANYKAHAGEKIYQGHEFLKKFTKQVRSAIPDIQVQKLEFLAQTKNTITWQRTFTGTHQAAMMGIPPSNKKVTWTEMVVTSFEGDKVVEEWVVSELAEKLLLNQPTTK
jgi:predicted ester cyclase